MSQEITELLEEVARVNDEIIALHAREARALKSLHECLDPDKRCENGPWVFGDFVVTVDPTFCTPHFRYKVSRAVPLPAVLTLEAPKGGDSVEC